MTAPDFDELTGRIDGIGQALLRMASLLEMEGLMDGPRLSEAWRQARPAHLATDVRLQASRHMLHMLADLLDQARQARSALPSTHPR